MRKLRQSLSLRSGGKREEGDVQNQPTTAKVQKSKTFPTGVKCYASPDNARVDIVFLHGLTGGREKTWKAKGCTEPWPQSLLPAEVRTARVISYGYDAYVSDWKGVVSKNRVENHAKTLLSALATFRGKDGTMLLASRNSADAHLKIIIESTIGIAFLGTPHHGSSLARWGELLASSIGLLKQTNPDIVRVLRRDSETLARIQSDFHTMLRDRTSQGLRPINISCFYEELPVPLIGEIVPKESAVLPGWIEVGIHGDHMSMTKFAAPEDPGFIAIVGELSRWSNNINLSVASTSSPSSNLALTAEVPTPAPQQAATTEASPSASWDLLRDALRPGDIITQQSQKSRTRFNGTCLWIQHHPTYSAWRDSVSSPPILWIHGSPGSGKSILASTIIKELSQKVQNVSGSSIAVVAYYFVLHDDEEQKRLHTLLRTTLYQVAQQDINIFNELLLSIRRLGYPSTSFSSSVSLSALYEVLKELLSSIVAVKPFYLVVDGLDEMSVEERDEGLSMLNDLAIELPSAKLLIFSRAENDIRDALSLSSKATIAITPSLTSSDIDLYARRLVQRWGHLGSEDVRTKVIDAITAKAQGMFLWVKLVMNELSTVHDVESVLSMVDRVPTDLKGMYNTILTDLRSRLSPKELRLHSTILEWTVMARKSIGYHQMASVLNTYGTFTAASLLASMNRLCGVLITLDRSTHIPDDHHAAEEHNIDSQYMELKLFHSSLAEYLLSDDSSCIHAIDQGATHASIALSCILHFKRASNCTLFYPIALSFPYTLHVEKSGKITACPSINGPLPVNRDDPVEHSSDYDDTYDHLKELFPLLTYSRKFWTYHAKSAAELLADTRSLVNEILVGFLLESSLEIWFWIAVLTSDKLPSHLQDLESFCDLLRSRSPLQAALLYAVVEDLLAVEAMANDPESDSSAFNWSNWSGIRNLVRSDAVEPDRSWNSLTSALCERFPSIDTLVYTKTSEVREEHSIVKKAKQTVVLSQTQSLLPDLSSGLSMTVDWPQQLTMLGRRIDLSQSLTWLDGSLESLWKFILAGRILVSADQIRPLEQLYEHSAMFAADANFAMARIRILRWRHDIDGTVTALKDLSKLHPDRLDIKEMLILELHSNGYTSDAVPYLDFERSEVHWCEGVWLCLRKAKLLESCGRLNQVHHTLLRGLTAFPSSIGLCRSAAGLYDRLEDYARASFYLRRLQENPKARLWATSELVKVLTKIGDVNEAEKEAQQLTIACKHHWRSYEVLWSTCASPQLMIDAFQTVIRQDEPRWEPFVYLAWAYIDCNRYHDSIAACRFSLDLEWNEPALYTLRRAYKAIGGLQEALSVFKALWKDKKTSNQAGADEQALNCIAELAQSTSSWHDLIWSLNEQKTRAQESLEVFKYNLSLAVAYADIEDYESARSACVEELSSQNKDRLRVVPMLVLLTAILDGEDVATACGVGLFHLYFKDEFQFEEDRLGELVWSQRESRDRKLYQVASFLLDVAIQLQASSGNSLDHDTIRIGFLRCDQCGQDPIDGVAFQCKSCDFDVCEPCFRELRDKVHQEHGFIKVPSDAYPRIHDVVDGG